jgi:CDP-glucose 4,6-dehydratase
MHLGKFGKKRQMNLFSNIYKDKKVLVTGHTGFKGAWLSFWLTKLGAQVFGISDKVTTIPSHFELLKIEMQSFMIDIRNKEAINDKIKEINPDIIFHLAAQPLVRYSYNEPVETFETNVMGTVNILNACLSLPNIKGVVNITSDKCYENFEDDRPYNEEDRMGGYDPYSASKGAAELVASSFRKSFFNPKDYGVKHQFILASARAGNVIGGGDWSEDRLIPDLIKDAVQNKVTTIRSPFSTRPWQHVLEPLSGYLVLGQKILEGDISVSDGWNFGPENNETLAVKEVLEVAKKFWNNIKFDFPNIEKQPHEASLLRLDCSKANQKLNWFPVWDIHQSIEKTINWYQKYDIENIINTEADLLEYINQAKNN